MKSLSSLRILLTFVWSKENSAARDLIFTINVWQNFYKTFMHLSSMLSLSFLRSRQVKASAFKRWSFLNIFAISFVFLSKKYFNLCPPPGPGVARNCRTYISRTSYRPWWSQPKRSFISFSVNLEGIRNLIKWLLEVRNNNTTNLFT